MSEFQKGIKIAQLRSGKTLYERVYLEDADPPGLFDLDSADVTTPDDGVDTILNFNQKRYKRLPHYTAGKVSFEGNTFYVSKIYGDNSKAQKGNFYRQYKDPWTAMQASTLGDRVVITDNSEYSCGPVGSGADFESDDVTKYNLAMHMRVLIGLNGATITNHASAASSSLFTDNPGYMVDRAVNTYPASAVVFKVFGNISVDWDADSPYLFQHEDSEFVGNFYDITFTSTTTYSYCFALFAPHWEGWDSRNVLTYPSDEFYYGGRVKRFEVTAHKIDCGTQNLYGSNGYFNYSDSAAYLYPVATDIYNGSLFGRNQLSRGIVRITADHVIQGRAYNGDLSNYDIFLNIGYLQGSINRGMAKNHYFCVRIDRAEYNPNYRDQFWFAYGGGQDSLYDVEVGSALLDSGAWIPNTLGNGAKHRFKFGLLELAPDATLTGSGAPALVVLGGTRVALGNDLTGKVYFEGTVISPRAGIHGMYITNTLVGAADTLPKGVYVSNTRIITEATANSIYSTVSNRDVYFGGGNVFNTALRSGYVNSIGAAPTIDANFPL